MDEGKVEVMAAARLAVAMVATAGGAAVVDLGLAMLATEGMEEGTVAAVTVAVTEVAMEVGMASEMAVMEGVMGVGMASERHRGCTYWPPRGSSEHVGLCIQRYSSRS